MSVTKSGAGVADDHKTIDRHFAHCVYIGSRLYSVYEFELSQEALIAARSVRRYFHALLKYDMPPPSERRFSSNREYPSLAVMVLARVYTALESDTPIVAGSEFLRSQAWAVFGNDLTTPTDNHFSDFREVVSHYELCNLGDKKKQYFLFRTAPVTLARMASLTGLSCNFLFSMSLVFLKDVVSHAGPDNAEFFDLFSNNVKLDPDKLNLDQWERLRCRFLGRFGEIDWRRYTGNWSPVEECRYLPSDGSGWTSSIQERRVAEVNFELVASGDAAMYTGAYMPVFPAVG